MFITLMQISQMFVGVGITIAAAIYSRQPNSCDVVTNLIPWCCAMYVPARHTCTFYSYNRSIDDGTDRPSDRRAGELTDWPTPHTPPFPFHNDNRYSTYLYFFVTFFVERFFSKPKPKAATQQNGSKKAN